MSKPYTRLWAKSEPPHPLWCHLLDVGVVVEALWDRVLSPSTRSRMARALGVSEERARLWVIWLGSLHDIGKASPHFQQQHEELKKHVRQAGFPFGPEQWEPHGVISSMILERQLRARGWDDASAQNLARAIGAHHGTVENLRHTKRNRFVRRNRVGRGERSR